VEFADEIHALEGIKKDRETIGSRYQTGSVYTMREYSRAKIRGTNVLISLQRLKLCRTNTLCTRVGHSRFGEVSRLEGHQEGPRDYREQVSNRACIYNALVLWGFSSCTVEF